LAKGEVFEHQTAARPKPAKHGSEPEPKQVKHGNKGYSRPAWRLPCEVIDFKAGQDCDEAQRSVKEECLAKLILLGEGSLRRALRHYEAHYHEERNHQGKDNLLLFPLPTQAVRGEQAKLRCRERLGALLKYYERKAA
jgi:hypothetical protein